VNVRKMLTVMMAYTAMALKHVTVLIHASQEHLLTAVTVSAVPTTRVTR
jgi:hypothetical protein